MLSSLATTQFVVQTAGFRIPIWGLPILIVAVIAASIYQKNRDKNR